MISSLLHSCWTLCWWTLLSKWISKSNSSRIPRVTVWNATAYHRQSELLRIVNNLNRKTRTWLKCWSSKSLFSIKTLLELSFNKIFPFRTLKRMFKTSFQQNTCHFFLGLRIYRICHHVCHHIKHVEDFVNRCLAHYSPSCTDELRTRIQRIRNVLCPRQIFKICSTRCHVIWQVHFGYTKHLFRPLNALFNLKMQSFVCISTSRLCII